MHQRKTITLPATIDPSFKRTRLAPTPSGFLHLGNALSFALTAWLARRHGASILLRIDDLDQARVRKEYVEDIFETLDFLSLPWDEGPRAADAVEIQYAQIHRLALYEQALLKLQERGLVYACTCSRAQLERQGGEAIYSGTCRHRNLPLDTPGACWRLHTTEREEEITLLNGGRVRAVLPPALHDVVVRKKDGLPAYQLASVVDDLYYEVDLVVRGEDLWPSTIVQHQIAAQLGADKFSKIRFYHHPLLLEAEGQKLSKSAGATSIRQLRREGRSPASIYALIDQWLGGEGTASGWEELAALVMGHSE